MSPGETAEGGRRPMMTAGNRWTTAAARWRRTGFRGAAAGVILAAAGLALAAAGDLDPGFGNGGTLVLPLTQLIHNWEGRAVAVQPDGKIVVAAQFQVTDPDGVEH